MKPDFCGPPAYLWRLMVVPAEVRVLPGAGMQFRAVGECNGGPLLDLTKAAQWGCSNPGHVSVEAGYAATSGDLTGRVEVSVRFSGPPPEGCPLHVPDAGPIPAPRKGFVPTLNCETAAHPEGPK